MDLHTSFFIKRTLFYLYASAFFSSPSPPPPPPKKISDLLFVIRVFHTNQPGKPGRALPLHWHTVSCAYQWQGKAVNWRWGRTGHRKHDPSSLPRSYSQKINDIKIISYSIYAFKTMQRQSFYDLFWEIQVSLYSNTQEFWHDVETIEHQC